MPKPRIYVDTTVPSAYHTDRTDPDSVERRATTRIWWNAAAAISELAVSDVVLQELADGRPEQALLRLELVKGLRRLRSGAAELATALTYMRHKVMPGKSARRCLASGYCLAPPMRRSGHVELPSSGKSEQIG